MITYDVRDDILEHYTGAEFRGNKMELRNRRLISKYNILSFVTYSEMVFKSRFMPKFKEKKRKKKFDEKTNVGRQGEVNVLWNRFRRHRSTLAN